MSSILHKIINYNKFTKYSIYSIVTASFLILMFSKPNEHINANKTSPDSIPNINSSKISDPSDTDVSNTVIDNTKDNHCDNEALPTENLTSENAKKIGISDEILNLITGVLKIVNQERKKEGLSPLSTNIELTNCATLRSKELVQLFSHTRPNGTSCFTILDENKVVHGTSGENIAAGYPTAAAVMDGWMHSEGHRANIMNPSFTKVGIGLYKTSDAFGYHWTQIFTN